MNGIALKKLFDSNISSSTATKSLQKKIREFHGLIALHVLHWCFSCFLLPCNYIHFTDVFAFSLVLLSLLLKQQYLILKLEIMLLHF